ncbi:MAG: hypothetical protein ABI540_05300 [Spartobacteria bacterium]
MRGRVENDLTIRGNVSLQSALRFGKYALNLLLFQHNAHHR